MPDSEMLSKVAESLDRGDFGPSFLGRLAEAIGPREVVEAGVADMVRKKYEATTNRNDRDGFYAGVVECKCDDKNCEVMKTAWIFERKSEALDYAEVMIKGIEARLVDENLKRMFPDFWREENGKSTLREGGAEG